MLDFLPTSLEHWSMCPESVEQIPWMSAFDSCNVRLYLFLVLPASVTWVSSYLGYFFQVARNFSQGGFNPVIRVIKVIRVI